LRIFQWNLLVVLAVAGIGIRWRVPELAAALVLLPGVPLGTPGATNMLRIAYVGEDSAGD